MEKIYLFTFKEIKERIKLSQRNAILSVNTEMIKMYWDIGQIINIKQQEKGWGAGVIPKLSQDIRNEMPEIKGFSERNIKRMLMFYREYSCKEVIVPQAVAQLKKRSQEKKTIPELMFQVPWGHNIILIEKVKDHSIRYWYLQQTIEQGWSRNTLASMINTNVHSRQGKVIHNFKNQLSKTESRLAEQTLKDPYIFDFLTLEEPYQERELETGVMKHLQKFLLELGRGFSFVGRQYHIEVDHEDYYIDLLFYHLKLRCFVVIDLKKGAFKPEYAGKINFYCNVIDDQLKHKQDKPTIGLILCQNKKKILVEYTLRGIKKPIGVSEYEITRALPNKLKLSLPTVKQLEDELSG